MVHFVYRSHYDNPGCFHVKRFVADTVLGWFQSIWKGVSNERPKWAGSDHAKRLVGRDVYSFGSLFGHIHEHGWPVPKTMRELADRLNDALYVNELSRGAHHVQIMTDDDELEMAIYIFDDVYAAKHPDRVAFLLLDDWKLPDGMATGKFKPPRGVEGLYCDLVAGEGRTYYAHFAAYDGGGLSDLEPGEMAGVFDGVRVPDLPRLLLAIRTSDAEEGPVDDVLKSSVHEVLTGLEPAIRTAKGTEALLLKAVAADPNDVACWSAYSDWCEEHGKPTLLERILKRCDGPSGHIRDTRNPKRDKVLVQSHVAQVSKHVGGEGKECTYHHLVFFDDLWANAHPHLAASLLRAACRWDIL